MKSYLICLVGDKLYEKKDLRKFHFYILFPILKFFGKLKYFHFKFMHVQIVIYSLLSQEDVNIFNLYAQKSIGIKYFPIGYIHFLGFCIKILNQ